MSAQTMAGVATHGELRLTRRGRRAVRTVAVLAVGTAVLTGGRAMADGPAPAVSVDSYTVGSGESLWSIASGFTEPGGDVRDTVDRLAGLNGMSGGSLEAGQQILVPVEG